jgi:Protein of unknown function (DUF1353)
MCRNGVDWLYKLEKNYTWQSNHPIAEDLVFKDKKEKVRLLVAKDGTITVMRGYSWDGCTPKFCVLDFLIGTPDGVVHKRTGHPKTYYASLVHDALYQFIPDGLPLGRRHADRFFLQLMAESDFLPRWVYWAAVRVFGGLFRRVMRVKRKTNGSAQSVAELVSAMPAPRPEPAADGAPPAAPPTGAHGLVAMDLFPPGGHHGT